jgi:hypothetical protein
MTSAKDYYSVGDLGDMLRIQSWRIARLFELGVLPEPPRVGGRRLIPDAMIPNIVTALRERGLDVQSGQGTQHEEIQVDG